MPLGAQFFTGAGNLTTVMPPTLMKSTSPQRIHNNNNNNNNDQLQAQQQNSSAPPHRQSASASQSEDLWWDTGDQLTAAAPLLAKTTDVAAVTTNNNVLLVAHHKGQQRPPATDPALSVVVGTTPVAASQHPSADGGKVGQLHALAGMLDQCDKLITALVTNGGHNNSHYQAHQYLSSGGGGGSKSPGQSIRPHHSPRGNSLGSIRSKMEDLQSYRAAGFRHRMSHQPLEFSDYGSVGGHRLSMMTRSSSGTASLLSKRDGGGITVGGGGAGGTRGGAGGVEDEVGFDLDDVVAPAGTSPSAVVPPMGSSSSAVSPHPPLVDVQTCESPQWGTDSIIASAHAAASHTEHSKASGGAVVAYSTTSVFGSSTAPQRSTTPQTSIVEQVVTASAMKSANERNLSICSQNAPATNRGGPQTVYSQAHSPVPHNTVNKPNLLSADAAAASAATLLEIQKHVQSAQSLLTREFMQRCMVIVDGATPIVRTPVGPAPGHNYHPANGLMIASHVHDEDVLSYAFPPALTQQQLYSQQRSTGTSRFVAVGPQPSEGGSICKPTPTPTISGAAPTMTLLGRVGGSVSSAVDYVTATATAIAAEALPSWPQGSQSPIADDFHLVQSNASLIDELMSTSGTTAVTNAAAAHKSVASTSLVSSACDESRAPEVQSVRLNGLQLTTTTTLIKAKDEFTGNKTVNEYLILDDIGEGACGKVKLAYCLQKNITVAIKTVRRAVVTDEGRALGRRKTIKEDTVRHEIGLMRKLRHPNLVSLFEVIDDPTAKKLYLVMRFADKGSVGAMRDDLTCDAMPLRALVDMTFQVCCGLQYLHERGIYHRDIKPENILQTSDGQYMIGDFGISIERRRRSTSTALSSSIDALLNDRPLGIGTPLFMAPELLASCVDDDDNNEHTSNNVTERVGLRAADMWALGVTIISLGLARWPFESAGAFRISPNDIANAAATAFRVVVAAESSQCASKSCSQARQGWAALVSGLLGVDPRTRPAARDVRKVSKALVKSICESCGSCTLSSQPCALATNEPQTSASASEDNTESTSFRFDGLQSTVGPGKHVVTRSMESVANAENGSNTDGCCSRGPSDVSSPTRRPMDDADGGSECAAEDMPSKREDDPLGHHDGNSYKAHRRGTTYESWNSTRPESEGSIVQMFSTEALTVAGVAPLTAHPPNLPATGQESPHRPRPVVKGAS